MPLVLKGTFFGKAKPQVFIKFTDPNKQKTVYARCKVTDWQTSPSNLDSVSCIISKQLINNINCKVVLKNKLAMTEFSNQPSSINHDIIIVGAGISGLTAGFYLQKHDVKILEKENRVGGRAVSGDIQGTKYTLGTEYLGKPEGPLKAIIKKLKLEAKEIPSPMDARYYQGKFYLGDDGLHELAVTYSSKSDYRHFVSTVLKKVKEYNEAIDYNPNSDIADLDDISAKEWFDNENFANIFYELYNVSYKGLFGANIEEISAMSALPETAFDYEGTSASELANLDSVTSATPAVKQYDTQSENRSGSYSFTGGITDLTDAMGNKLSYSIQLNSTVTAISYENDIYQVIYNNASGNQQSLYAKVVILAVPAPIAIKLAGDLLSQEKLTLMQQIHFAPYMTLALTSDEKLYNQSFDLSVPEGFFFTDIYDNSWIPEFYGKTPSGPEVISVYIAPQTYTSPGFITMDEDEILSRVYTDLDKILPGASSKVTGYHLHRFKYAYPVMTTGAYKRLKKLNELNTGTLLLSGDYLIYPTFEAAAESGYIASKKAIWALKSR